MARTFAFAGALVCIFAEHQSDQACSDDSTLLQVQTHRISVDADCNGQPPPCAWDFGAGAACPSFTLGQFTVGEQGLKECPAGQKAVDDAETCILAANLAGIATKGNQKPNTGQMVNKNGKKTWAPAEFFPLQNGDFTGSTCFWAGAGSGLFEMGTVAGRGSKFICSNNCEDAPEPKCEVNACNGRGTVKADCSCECDPSCDFNDAKVKADCSLKKCTNDGVWPHCIPPCAWDNTDPDCPPFTMGRFTVGKQGVLECAAGQTPVTDLESCDAAAAQVGFVLRGKPKGSMVDGKYKVEKGKWQEPVDGVEGDKCFWGGAWGEQFYLNSGAAKGAKILCQGGTCR